MVGRLLVLIAIAISGCAANEPGFEFGDPEGVPSEVAERLQADGLGIESATFRANVGRYDFWTMELSGSAPQAAICIVFVAPFELTEEAEEAGLPDLGVAVSRSCKPAGLATDQGIVAAIVSGVDDGVAAALLPSDFAPYELDPAGIPDAHESDAETVAFVTTPGEHYEIQALSEDGEEYFAEVAPV